MTACTSAGRVDHAEVGAVRVTTSGSAGCRCNGGASARASSMTVASMQSRCGACRRTARRFRAGSSPGSTAAAPHRQSARGRSPPPAPPRSTATAPAAGYWARIRSASPRHGVCCTARSKFIPSPIPRKTGLKHMTATLMPPGPDATDAAPLDVDALRAALPEQAEASAIYPLFRDIGLDYGPAFQGITRMHRRRGEALAEIVAPEPIKEGLGDHVFHPALLDACFTRSSVPSVSIRMTPTCGDVYLPVRIDRFVVRGPVTGVSTRTACYRTRTADRLLQGRLSGSTMKLGDSWRTQRECSAKTWSRQTGIFPRRSTRGLMPIAGSRLASNTRRLLSTPSEQNWLLLCDERGVGSRVAEILEEGRRHVHSGPARGRLRALGSVVVQGWIPRYPSTLSRLLAEVPDATRSRV